MNTNLYFDKVEKELDKMSDKEFNEVLASLSHTNCKDKACDCNECWNREYEEE